MQNKILKNLNQFNVSVYYICKITIFFKIMCINFFKEDFINAWLKNRKKNMNIVNNLMIIKGNF